MTESDDDGNKPTQSLQFPLLVPFPSLIDKVSYGTLILL